MTPFAEMFAFDGFTSVMKKRELMLLRLMPNYSLYAVNYDFWRLGRIRWMHVRNDELGAYAASMDDELDVIGCCMGSSGPGNVHLINGIYDANRAGNPVIAIARTINTDNLGQDN